MKHHSQRFVDLAEQAKNQVREISNTQVKEKLDSNNIQYLIDVREESEWNNGRLPNTIHLSKGVIERDIEKNITDPNAEIILYCGGGYRSALAAENLQRMGYTNVLSMAGGFRGWEGAGYPIEVK